MSHDFQIFRLAANGVELLIDTCSGSPVVSHWGRQLASEALSIDLPKLLSESTPHADLDRPLHPGMWRERGRGFFGAPALEGQRGRQDWAPLFTLVDHQATETSLEFTSRDEHAGLEVGVRFEITPQGVLLVTESVKNIGASPYSLVGLTTWMPLPDRAVEAMDFHGRWVKERQPQRQEIKFGTQAREIRDGRSGHGYTIVHLAMTKGANYSAGEVWGLSLMWSGNTKHAIEKTETGRRAIGAGELLEAGEVELAPGESYTSPTVVASYSARGFDGISQSLHAWTRGRAQHAAASKPRPLTLNVWEAVYFDHRMDKLTELLQVAKEIGVERFVLDDGWFGDRRNDWAGLGDWVVSKEVWPDGLLPLSNAVHAAGMEFGLWFEGEMVNPNSDLYRAHPDWILHIPGRTPIEGRHQHVLDITNPDAYQHVLGQVDQVIRENKVDYIKWDHNKLLIDPGHAGIAAVRKQTLAIYRLFDELKRRNPGLEIESCSSGGARIDLGMVQHVDRFWGSDCNDALERQYIQRYTGFAIPPEMIGAHIGPTHSHTTGRTHELSFRAITALFGHAGLEWDITETTAEERVLLASWSDYYKANRALLHGGDVVRVDHSDPAAWVHGVVAADKSRAIFAYVQLDTTDSTKPDAVLLSGLDAASVYRVEAVYPAGKPSVMQIVEPAWLSSGLQVSGAVLSEIGLRPPVLRPENALLIEVTKIG